MKIDKLFKHYDGLETNQRPDLIFATNTKGDKEERGGLVRTVPRWAM